jgi:hypothetical protein
MTFGLQVLLSISTCAAKQWHIANMAAIAAGGFAAGIYTTNVVRPGKHCSPRHKMPLNSSNQGLVCIG